MEGSSVTVHKDTDLGRIMISDRVFAVLIARTASQEDFSGRIWLSTRKGRLVTGEMPGTGGDWTSGVEAVLNKKGRIELSCCVIVRFGVSIRETITAFSDALAGQIRSETGRAPALIRTQLTGVLSKNVSWRSMEVVRRYAAH